MCLLVINCYIYFNKCILLSQEVASEVAEVYVIPKAKLNKILSRLPDSSGLLKAFNPDVLSLISTLIIYLLNFKSF
jgi:hypothetical protein